MKKHLAGWLKWVGFAAIAVVAVYVVLLLVSGARLRAAYATLEEAGRPMTFEDIVPEPIPDQDNGAYLYQAAVLLLKATPVMTSHVVFSQDDRLGSTSLWGALALLRGSSDPDDPRSPEQTAELIALLNRPEVDQALALVAEAGLRPGCRYDLDYAEGAALMLPHLGDMRNLARLLRARADRYREHGNLDEAWQDVLTGLRLALALQDESLLISQLVRIANANTMLETVPELLAAGTPNPETLADIDRTLEQLENLDFVPAFDGERILFGEWAFALSTAEFLAIIQDSVGPGSGQQAASRLRLKPLIQADHAAYLTAMARFTARAGRPYADDTDTEIDSLEDTLPWYAVTSRALIPSLTAVLDRQAEAQAQIRLARTGLAAANQRHETGSWPTTLPELDGAAPLDPYTGQPLHYTATSTGVQIYSVGPNQTDDDGAPYDKEDKSGDLVWEITIPTQ